MERIRSRLRLNLVIVSALISIGLLSSACGAVPAAGIAEGATVGSGSRPHPASAVVWIGLTAVKDVLLLDRAEFEDLRAGALVISDDQGEGWIPLNDCAQIYTFPNSGLLKSTCQDSDVVIKTLSAEIQVQGTWAAVTYEPAHQVTVVSVLEAGGDTAKVVARPAGSINPRFLGDPVTVPAGHFWFNTPGVMPGPISGLKPRMAHRLDWLPAVAQEFGLWRWNDKIEMLAHADRVPYPDLVPLVAVPAETIVPTPTAPPTGPIAPEEVVKLIGLNLPPATTTPPESPTATPTSTPIPPTQELYPQPQLVGPAPLTRFRDEPVMLRWHYDSILGSNDYFDVRVWFGGQAAKGIAWTKEPEFTIGPHDIFWRFGPGFYHWEIVVVRGNNGQWLADLSRPSDAWSFEWLPR